MATEPRPILLILLAGTRDSLEPALRTRSRPPMAGAELAYDSLIKELRKYTIIQLGDYRRVEFNAF